MSISSPFVSRAWMILILALLSVQVTAQEAPGKSPAATSAVTTNDAPVLIPESKFVMPTKPEEGRDPFFPNSPRPYATQPKVKPAVSGASLVLIGVSGTVEKPFAIINGRTLAENEEAEVTTPTGRIHIRCLSINVAERSTIIEVIGGERRELRMPREL